ncbi:MAG: transporter substrate-binding domain-containing protein [bacterium]
MNNISTKNGMKLEFVEQSGYGVISERLNSGYADIFCSPVRPTKTRRLEMFFSKSFFKSNIFAYMNKTSHYSEKSLNNLRQNKELRIAVKENDIHHDIAKEFFPNARLIWVPQLSDISEVLKFVIDNRADMTFWEDNLVEQYIKQR